MLATGPLSLPGTNGTATVEGSTTGKSQIAQDPSFSNRETRQPAFFPQVTVRLPGNSGPGSSEPVESLAQSMEQEKLRQTVLDRVRPLLPESAFTEPDRAPVKVEFASTPTAPQPLALKTTALNQWLSSRTGGIWIAVVSTAGLSLLLIFSLRRREQGNDRPISEASYGQAEEAREIKLKQQIDELLRTDPDTAANVIREWIQKAA
jgi:hypothetical protein